MMFAVWCPLFLSWWASSAISLAVCLMAAATYAICPVQGLSVYLSPLWHSSQSFCILISSAKKRSSSLCGSLAYGYVCTNFHCLDVYLMCNNRLAAPSGCKTYPIPQPLISHIICLWISNGDVMLARHDTSPGIIKHFCYKLWILAKHPACVYCCVRIWFYTFAEECFFNLGTWKQLRCWQFFGCNATQVSSIHGASK